MSKIKFTIPEITQKLNRSTRINQPVKIDNNTFAEIYQDRLFISLHGSVIADLGIDKIRLYTNGWHTPTTKERLNRVLWDNSTGFRVYQESNLWYVGDNYKNYRFAEGITFTRESPNYWIISNFAIADDRKQIDAKKRQIRGYVKRYVDNLNQGKITYPDINCLGCQIKSSELTHLKIHIEKDQFPFIMVINAIEKYPISIIAKTELSAIYFNESDNLLNNESLNQITINQITSSLSRYLIDKLITN